MVHDFALVGGEGRIVLRGDFLEVLAVVRYLDGDFTGVVNPVVGAHIGVY